MFLIMKLLVMMLENSMHGNGIINHREALNDMLNNKIKRGYKEP